MRKGEVLAAILTVSSLAGCSRPPAATAPVATPPPAQIVTASPTATPTIVNFPGGGQAEFPAGMNKDAINRIVAAIRQQAAAASQSGSSEPSSPSPAPR